MWPSSTDPAVQFLLDRAAISELTVRIEDLGVRLADEEEWQFLKRTMQAKCKAFGTTMEGEGKAGTVEVM